MSQKSQINWRRWSTLAAGLLLLRGVACGASRVTAFASDELRYQVFEAVSWIKDAK